MAICAGCSAGGCTCEVDGTSITGTGTAGDPFVAGCSCAVDGVTITGAGTPGDPFVAAGGGGGGGGPFLVVASSTTAPARQAIADYVCDGTADEVEIHQAVVDLTSGHPGFDWGGTIYLLEGDYHTSAPINLGFSVNLQGAGLDATFIYFDFNGDAGPRAGGGIPDPYGVDYVIIGVGDGHFVSDLYINQDDNSGTGFRGGIRLDGEMSLATRVFADIYGNPGLQPIQNSGIRLNSRYSTVSDSRIEAFDSTAIDGNSDLDFMKVENNYIAGSIGFDGNGTPNLYIGGNFFFGGAAIGATVYDYSGVNSFAYGNGIVIWAGPVGPSIITGNRIEGFARSGILIDDANSVSVVNNVINGCSQAAANTYNGIWIRENCYAVNVQGNMVRGSGDHKYGIEVGTSLSTLVTNNDLLDSGTTGSIFDGGTATITAAGNRL